MEFILKEYLLLKLLHKKFGNSKNSIIFASLNQLTMLEHILSDIELRENTTNENTFDVWFDADEKRFLANENNGVRSYAYKLKDDIENITKQHRNEILEYRLGRVTKDDVLTIADIFMHGNFIDRLN